MAGIKQKKLSKWRAFNSKKKKDYQRGVMPTQIGKYTQRKNRAGNITMTSAMLIQPIASFFKSRSVFAAITTSGNNCCIKPIEIRFSVHWSYHTARDQ